MFEDTQPTELDASGAGDPWAVFRLAQPFTMTLERLLTHFP